MATTLHKDYEEVVLMPFADIELFEKIRLQDYLYNKRLSEIYESKNKAAQKKR